MTIGSLVCIQYVRTVIEKQFACAAMRRQAKPVANVHRAQHSPRAGKQNTKQPKDISKTGARARDENVLIEDRPTTCEPWPLFFF